MTLLSILLVLIYVVSVGLVQANYLPNWQSLDSRPLPSWYDDAKFGIFIHWGVYSVPSWAPVGTYAEWYWNALESGPDNPTYQFHVKTYGSNFQYQDFTNQFRAELFDPDQWADLFVRSGAKYVVPTSKHHEGFTLWPSAQSWNWNSMDVGPHRDLLGDLFTSLKRRNLFPCLYYSLYEWFNPIYRGANPREYVSQIMLPQLYDLVNTYQPQLIFADGEWEHNSTFWNSTEFLAWLYNDSPVKDSIIVNDRWGSDTRGIHGGYFTAEYSTQTWLNHKWEANRGIDVFSFGYNRNSQAGNYSSTKNLINILVSTVAFGGNLLLDIGPAHDGTIPVVMQERLLEIGEWLSVNGEAIYYSRPWTIQQEGNGTIYYTMNPTTQTVYAIFLKWPVDNQLVLNCIETNSESVVFMLGNEGKLEWSSSISGNITVQLPVFIETIPCSHAWVLQWKNIKSKCSC